MSESHDMGQAETGGQRRHASASDATTFWAIEPAAALGDSRWQDRAVWARVVVIATSAAFARRAAEAWALPRVPPQIGNESDSPQSGFLDEKLYRVREVPPPPGWRLAHRLDADQVVEAEMLRAAPDIIES